MITRTAIFTTTDIRTAFENLEADLKMLVLRTGDKSLAWAEDITHDIILFAINGCLESIHIQCLQFGTVTKAHKYTIETGIDWDSQRPGGNNWPRESNLGILLSLSSKWEGLSALEKASIMKHLRKTWSSTSLSTNYSHLREVGERSYSSGAYGLRRQTYERI